MGKLLQFNMQDTAKDVTSTEYKLTNSDLMALKLMVVTGKELTATEFSKLPDKLQHQLIIEQATFLSSPEDYILKFEEELKSN